MPRSHRNPSPAPTATPAGISLWWLLVGGALTATTLFATTNSAANSSRASALSSSSVAMLAVSEHCRSIKKHPHQLGAHGPRANFRSPLHNRSFIDGLQAVFQTHGSKEFIIANNKKREKIRALHAVLAGQQLSKQEQISLCRDYRTVTMKLHRATKRELDRNKLLRYETAIYHAQFCKGVSMRRIALKHDEVFKPFIRSINNKRLARALAQERQSVITLIEAARASDSKRETAAIVGKLKQKRKKIERLFSLAFKKNPRLEQRLGAIIKENSSRISRHDRVWLKKASFDRPPKKSNRVALSC